MGSEGVIHAAYEDSIVDYLRQVLTGKVWIREAHPITINNSEPEPDIVVVKSPKNKYFQNHPVASDIFWLIEISDTTLNYDLNQKKSIYPTANIAEYWVVNIKEQKLIIFTKPKSSDYLTCRELIAGTVQPVNFSSISISIEKLWKQ